MKQTQTKLFDWSDKGLDFCSGSKSLFPDRFKKMLALGYNEQTVVNVSVSGNQVTLNYGVSHGYVADRVLKIKTGTLAEINNGEFWIDSVTSNTLTITIDDAPSLIDGNFTTLIAPLGWELVYESVDSFIQAYKFRHTDNTPRYARLVFQSNLSHRNAMTCCIGKTFDVETGYITDELSYTETRSNQNPNINSYEWMFTKDANATWNDYTSTQGSAFGKCYTVGSLFHFLTCTNYHTSEGASLSLNCINGIAPTSCQDYGALDYPAILGYLTSAKSTTLPTVNSYQIGKFIIGNIVAKLDRKTSYIAISPVANSSVLSSQVDPFAVTTSIPLQLYEESSDQFLGVVPFGLYLGCYSSGSKPGTYNSQTPTLDQDSNSQDLVIKHCLGAYNTVATPVFFHLPIRGIVYAD